MLFYSYYIIAISFSIQRSLEDTNYTFKIREKCLYWVQHFLKWNLNIEQLRVNLFSKQYLLKFAKNFLCLQKECWLNTTGIWKSLHMEDHHVLQLTGYKDKNSALFLVACGVIFLKIQAASGLWTVTKTSLSQTALSLSYYFV